jgi:TRAP-type mannitol/chloroaromatic compound transport system permease small subunit
LATTFFATGFLAATTFFATGFLAATFFATGFLAATAFFATGFFAATFFAAGLTESIIYGHAALIMLAAAWTLREGGHVRVDIFYADAGPRTKAWIDLLGALLLLLPFMLALAWLAMPYVARSWAIFERSRETSGIPAVFLLKTLIPLFALMLAMQGVSQAIRASEVLRAANAARQ